MMYTGHPCLEICEYVIQYRVGITASAIAAAAVVPIIFAIVIFVSIITIIALAVVKRKRGKFVLLYMIRIEPNIFCCVETMSEESSKYELHVQKCCCHLCDLILFFRSVELQPLSHVSETMHHVHASYD